MSHARTALVISTFVLCSGPAWASPIVMNLSITDPVQTTEPGAVIIFHFELVNTIGINLPVFGFVNLDAPAYLSEIVVPFTVPANATVTGTLSFQVASTATSGLQTFATNAASTLHDPVSGDSYVSNFATVSVNVVPEPSTILLFTVGFGVLLTMYAGWGRKLHGSR
jgi:PEP-CTERM motif